MCVVPLCFDGATQTKENLALVGSLLACPYQVWFLLSCRPCSVPRAGERNKVSFISLACTGYRTKATTLQKKACQRKHWLGKVRGNYHEFTVHYRFLNQINRMLNSADLKPRYCSIADM